MIRVGHIISTAFDKAKRLVATMRINGSVTTGKGDVKTPLQTSAFGFDSNPTKGKVGLYVQSGKDGKYYLIGTINTECITKPGESRMFSTNADKEFKAQIYLTNTGNFLIGDKLQESDYNNFGVKFNQLKTEFNKLKADYNELVGKVNANAALLGTHTHPYVNVVTPATTSPSGIAGVTGTPNTSNIDNVKHNKIKYSE